MRNASSQCYLLHKLKATDYFRTTTTLQTRPRDQPLKIPRARQNPPKEKKAIFEQNEEFHVSTSQNPRFLAKIFLLMRFEKILNTQS